MTPNGMLLVKSIARNLLIQYNKRLILILTWRPSFAL